MARFTRKTLAANLKGTDYIIGDLHGSYDLLMRMLIDIDFDFLHDRLISCGDITDRGPKSLDCLTLLDSDWFYMTLGNHDMALIDAIDRPAEIAWLLDKFHGGYWALKHFRRIRSDAPLTDDDHTLLRCADKLRQQPHMISIQKKDGSYAHVMHADLNYDGLITTAKLMDDSFMDDLFQKSYNIHRGRYDFMWDRNRFNHLNIDRNTKREIRRSKCLSTDIIICGHTTMALPTRIGNFINLDTGAWNHKDRNRTQGLTCLNLDTMQTTFTNAVGTFPSIIMNADFTEF